MAAPPAADGSGPDASSEAVAFGAGRRRLAARHQRGATLIELVISIVVVAVAVSAILGLLARNAATSADAMVLAQAVSVAEAYIEEITLKPLVDPDGVNGEGARSAYDDVNDYNGLVDVGARDQFGSAIPALAGYTVAVGVSASSALPGVPGSAAARVDVRVTFSPGVDFTISSYKTL
ncbi:MAG TPA: prepilin-type N-terminal cleavage/methylation domain-containing protein [Gammaproteobacteria bacterium]|nr:prepilin-type N-terminal cleavage/methylation domain-containing protein [Gammaproteobacteria bacterium]